MATGIYNASSGGGVTSPKRKKYRKSIKMKAPTKMPTKAHKEMPMKGMPMKRKMM